MKKGFTLIELLAVIAILAIIMVIATPRVMDAIESSKQSAYEPNTDMIENAAQLYLANNTDATKVSLQTLVDQDLLSAIPDDPRTNQPMDGMVILYNGRADYKMSIYDDSLLMPHNTPEISKNMYPVKWNTTSNKWEVTTTDDNEWYLYNGDIDNSGDADKNNGTGAFTADKWANVQITTDKLSDGDLIEEVDLNLYVWIPRYTYLLNEVAQTISIRYTDGITDDKSGGYLSHPGFTFGDQELTGIWVAKFQMSYDKTETDLSGGTYQTGNDFIFRSRPNSSTDPARGTSFIEQRTINIISRNININDIFGEAREIEEEFNINADSHLIKSSEWSAVAYLTEAIRDGEEVWINNQGTYDNDAVTAALDSYFYYYRDYFTGCTEGPAKTSSPTEDNSCSNPYNTSQGQKGSTTGNIYGVYDMVGALFEYVSTYLEDNLDNTTYDFRYTSTSYMKEIVNSANKYKEILPVDRINPYVESNQNSVDNYNYYSDTQGLNLHEVSTTGAGTTPWYNDHTYYFNECYPAFLRGGHFNNGTSAGLFAFHRTTGASHTAYGWRATIAL